MENFNELRSGFETAYIGGSVVFFLAYRSQVVFNNYQRRKESNCEWNIKNTQKMGNWG